MCKLLGTLLGIVILGISSEATETITITNDHLNPQYNATGWGNYLLKRMFGQMKGQLFNLPRLRGKAQQKDVISGDSGPCGFPSVIEIPDGSIKFDNELLKGFFEYENTRLENLDTCWYEYQPDTLNLRLSAGIGLKNLRIKGNYNMDLEINMTRSQQVLELIPGLPPVGRTRTLESTHAQGNGSFLILLEQLLLNFSMELHAEDGKIQGVSTGLVFSLDSFHIFFEDTVFNEVPLKDHWPVINGFIARELVPTTAAVGNSLHQIMDLGLGYLAYLLQNCFLDDIVKKDFSCLALPILPPMALRPTQGPDMEIETTALPTMSSTTEESDASSYRAMYSVIIIALSFLTLLY